jgi:hypothetical protein
MSSRLFLLLALCIGVLQESYAQTSFRNLQNFGGELSFDVATTFTIPLANGPERIVAAGNTNGQGIRFFSSIGSNGTKTGAFVEKTSLLTSSTIAANLVNLQAQDLNADGFSDLVFRTKDPSVGAAAPGTIGYALFDPTQSKFLPQVTFSTIDAGIPVVTDINNDGRADIVFSTRNAPGTGSGAANVTAQIQNAAGGFSAQTIFALGTSFLPTEILLGIADYDSDGDKDILYVQYSAVGFGFDAYIKYLENSPGGFTNQQITVFPSVRIEKILNTDLDNNGIVDAVLTLSNSSLFTGTYGVAKYHKQSGNWVYQVLVPNQIIGLPSARGMEVGDYNGDGRKDLFFAGTYDPISIFAQSASGTFSNVSTTALAGLSGLNNPPIVSTFRIAPPILLADFNEDSVMDVLLPGAAHSGTLLAGNGTNFFNATNTAGFDYQFPNPQPEPIKSVCLGKLSASSVIDAVLVSQSTVLQSSGAGTGAFQPTAQLSAPISSLTTKDCALLDFDGDSDDDLVLAATPSDRILINNGAGTFTQSSISLTSSSSLVKQGDFNVDGRSDFFLGGTSASIILNTTSGLVSIPVAVTQGFTVVKAEFSDIDGITGQELVMVERDSAGNSNAVIVAIDLQTLLSQRTLVLPSSRDISLGDFNVDGIADTLVVPTSSSLPFVLSSTSGYNPTINFSGAKLSVAADFTGDGSTDIVLLSDSSAALFANNGTGVFQQTSFDSGIQNPLAALVKDIDLDGDNDLVINSENARGARPRLIANISNQFQISSFTRIGATSGTQITGVLDSAVPAIGFVFASLDPLSAPLPTPWGFLRLTNFVAGPNFVLTGTGAPVTFNFTLPYTPSLIGGQMTVQTAFLDFSGGLKLSNAREVKLIQ